MTIIKIIINVYNTKLDFAEIFIQCKKMYNHKQSVENCFESPDSTKRHDFAESIKMPSAIIK